MKANKAPEKLYFGERDEAILDIYSTKESDNEVEYTQTDAFIEKACAFIRERLYFGDNSWYTDGEVTLKDEVIEEFKNYMKGE